MNSLKSWLNNWFSQTLFACELFKALKTHFHNQRLTMSYWFDMNSIFSARFWILESKSDSSWWVVCFCCQAAVNRIWSNETILPRRTTAWVISASASKQHMFTFINYDESEEESQAIQSAWGWGRVHGWVTKTSDFHTGDGCLFPVSIRQSTTVIFLKP